MRSRCLQLLSALVLAISYRCFAQDTDTPNVDNVDEFNPNLPAGCVTRDRHLGWQSHGERGISMRSCESAIRTMANAESRKWNDNLVFEGRGGALSRDSVQTPKGYVAGKPAQTHAECPKLSRSSPKQLQEM